jgi:hypothetical protein
LIRLAEMARPRLGVTLIPAYLLVRFTLESGHVRCKGPCLLWAKSGHTTVYSITSLDAPVGLVARIGQWLWQS